MRVALDVGFERDELNTNILNVDLADNEQHIAVVTRLENGRKLVVKVLYCVTDAERFCRKGTALSFKDAERVIRKCTV